MTDRQTDSKTDRQIRRQIEKMKITIGDITNHVSVDALVIQTDRQIGGQSDRHTGIQTDRQTYR